MLSLLKVFGRGIVTTLLLPFILLVWVGYGVYCLGLFAFMFFKGVIDYFKGKDFNGDMLEDLEAKRILLEKEKSDEQAKQMLNIMYQNAVAQAQVNNPQPEPSEEKPVTPITPYGPEVFDQTEEPGFDEEPSIEEEEVNSEESNDDFGSY